MQPLKGLIQAHRFTVSTYEPMEQLNIDFIGPLTPDMYEHKYILVVIDTFTRFIELFPTKEADTASTVKALTAHAGRYGVPLRILSDRGSHFNNEVLKLLCEAMGVRQRFTNAYSKEENAIVERSNKETVRHLRNIVVHKKVRDRWSDSIPLVQRIYNATPNASIGCSPAQLLFGNAITLDRGIYLEHTPFKEKVKLQKWLDHMMSRQRDIIDTAVSILRQHHKKHVEEAEPSTEEELEINSLVLVGYPETNFGRGPPSKLHPNLKGPFRVVNQKDDIVTVQNLLDNKLTDHHVSLIQPYITSDMQLPPEEVATWDDGVYEVEEIREHKGNVKDKSSLTFLVKWAGYEEMTWEPWEHVRFNVKLHEYLKKHKLKRLIPKSMK
jgi:hypothetical protein